MFSFFLLLLSPHKKVEQIKKTPVWEGDHTGEKMCYIWGRKKKNQI